MTMTLSEMEHETPLAFIRKQNEKCSGKFLKMLQAVHGREVSEPPAPVIEKPESVQAVDEVTPEAAIFPALHKVEIIKRMVCKQFNIPRQLIESATRKANVVRPRQIAMYLVRKHTEHSYAEIGRRLGGRDHSTILHAFHKIEVARVTDFELAKTLEHLEAQI